jgi:uncharacterized protein YodC (DUF2158 family)
MENGIRTHWECRWPDLLTEQRSAHRTDGSETKISRTINLKSGVETVIDLDAIADGKKNCKTVKTNAVKKAKGVP